MMDVAKSETFKNCTILNKALLFLIKLDKIAVHLVPKLDTNITAALIEIYKRKLFTGQLVERYRVRLWSWGSILGPFKSNTVLPTACYRCNASSNEAVLSGRNNAEMGPANSLHASS